MSISTTEVPAPNLGNNATPPGHAIELRYPQEQSIEPLRGRVRPVLHDVVDGLERAQLRKRRPDDFHRRRRARSAFATAA
jgi:hypothetical protein